MKCSKISLLFLCLSLFCFTTYADTTTIVLQNGVDEYQGCDDSYINKNTSTAQGSKTSASMLNELCAS